MLNICMGHMEDPASAAAPRKYFSSRPAAAPPPPLFPVVPTEQPGPLHLALGTLMGHWLFSWGGKAHSPDDLSWSRLGFSRSLMVGPPILCGAGLGALCQSDHFSASIVPLPFLLISLISDSFSFWVILIFFCVSFFPLLVSRAYLLCVTLLILILCPMFPLSSFPLYLVLPLALSHLLFFLSFSVFY